MPSNRHLRRRASDTHRCSEPTCHRSFATAEQLTEHHLANHAEWRDVDLYKPDIQIVCEKIVCKATTSASVKTEMRTSDDSDEGEEEMDHIDGGEPSAKSQKVACPQCGFAVHTSHLTAHSAVHQWDASKTHRCRHGCPSYFRTKNSAYMHWRRYHKGDVEWNDHSHSVDYDDEGEKETKENSDGEGERAAKENNDDRPSEGIGGEHMVGEQMELGAEESSAITRHPAISVIDAHSRLFTTGLPSPPSPLLRRVAEKIADDQLPFVARVAIIRNVLSVMHSNGVLRDASIMRQPSTAGFVQRAIRVSFLAGDDVLAHQLCTSFLAHHAPPSHTPIRQLLKLILHRNLNDMSAAPFPPVDDEFRVPPHRVLCVSSLQLVSSEEAVLCARCVLPLANDRTKCLNCDDT